ncbi:MAG TPA: choice-of-anchor P family protein, partial [Thermoplasmata archaeon]|nr:choice-of-anchor P family protein [Thermoplasmata archaeon]
MHAFAYGARRVKGHRRAGFALLFALVVVATGLSALAGGGYAPSDVGTMSTAYGGRAYGVSTSIPLIGDTTYADTGELPADGGALFADFTPVGDSVASATVFLSYTRGFLDGGRSEVSASDITLLRGDPFEVVASFAYAGATATCGGASGTSEIPDLTVGGVSVPVTGEPNQIYSIPGVLTLVINEQNGGTQDMTVNALHLTTVAGIEAVVASARSMVDCSGGGLPAFGLSASSVGTGVTPMWGVPPKDFVTGGGFFFANFESTCVGDRVNFGFNAGPRPGTWSPDPPFGIKGHLNLIDHGPFCAVRHVEGTDVTDYYVVGDEQNKCRYFE